MDFCLDWALHRFQQRMHITMEMAPNGLRNMAYDLCQAAWDRTSELRDIERSTCERLPIGARPTWLWAQRRAGTNYAPVGVEQTNLARSWGKLKPTQCEKDLFHMDMLY
eukprot:2713728-Pyramimonas_sp.AAC.1